MAASLSHARERLHPDKCKSLKKAKAQRFPQRIHASSSGEAQAQTTSTRLGEGLEVWVCLMGGESGQRGGGGLFRVYLI